MLAWDIKLGEGYDFTHKKSVALIIGWLSSSLVRGMHLATPCGSFSRARDVPPGPPPLRPNEQPLGLEGLSLANQRLVDTGNVLMRNSARICSVATRLNAMWSLENPQRSRL